MDRSPRSTSPSPQTLSGVLLEHLGALLGEDPGSILCLGHRSQEQVLQLRKALPLSIRMQPHTDHLAGTAHGDAHQPVAGLTDQFGLGQFVVGAEHGIAQCEDALQELADGGFEAC